jgi:hypothetical protein
MQCIVHGVLQHAACGKHDVPLLQALETPGSECCVIALCILVL